jgi:hypothetical protein
MVASGTFMVLVKLPFPGWLIVIVWFAVFTSDNE